MVALGWLASRVRQEARREQIIANGMHASMIHVDDKRVKDRPPLARRTPVRSEPTPARSQFQRNNPFVVDMKWPANC